MNHLAVLFAGAWTVHDLAAGTAPSRALPVDPCLGLEQSAMA
jgi:hypothetical protein